MLKESNGESDVVEYGIDFIECLYFTLLTSILDNTYYLNNTSKICFKKSFFFLFYQNLLNLELLGTTHNKLFH